MQVIAGTSRTPTRRTVESIPTIPQPAGGLVRLGVQVVPPQLVDRTRCRFGRLGFGLVPGCGAAGDGGGFAEAVDGGVFALVPVEADHADAGVAGEQPSGPHVADVLADAGLGEPAGWDDGGRDPVGGAEPGDPVGEFGEPATTPTSTSTAWAPRPTARVTAGRRHVLPRRPPTTGQERWPSAGRFTATSGPPVALSTVMRIELVIHAGLARSCVELATGLCG